MKVGILTYHSVYNFGANLQVYSTVEYLKNNGFDPIVINWIPLDLESGYDKSNPSEQITAHKDFIRKKLPVSELCRTTQDVIEVIKKSKIEKVLIGSDAVLQHRTLLARVRITRKGITLREKRSNVIYPNPYWGSFISGKENQVNVHVISASSQNTNYNLIRGKIRRDIGRSILRMKSITVRDRWTQDMISYLTFKRVIPSVTPDPVFAYNQNISDQISKDELVKKFNLPEKYFLLSFKNKRIVSKEWIEAFVAKAANRGYEAILLTMPGGIIFDNVKCRSINPPLLPDEWYSLIKHANGYIGENMHPIVVAIHNVVPFFSFDSYGITTLRYFVNERSSKIFDLLEEPGLMENRVCTLGPSYKCPDAEYVLDRVEMFEHARCRSFSIIQLQRYNDMMKRICEK